MAYGEEGEARDGEKLTYVGKNSIGLFLTRGKNYYSVCFGGKGVQKLRGNFTL